MKKIGPTLVLLTIFFILSSFLQAQDEERNFGIGVSLSKEALWLEDFLIIYMPIDISSKFRLEPEIGFLLQSESAGIWEETSIALSVGLGIFAMKQKEKINIYYGARTGFIIDSYVIVTRRTRTDFYIGPALGGEYFFSNHFSLGGEIQLSYAFIGIFEGGANGSEMKTKPLVFVRWYF
ncbi:MAG: hypothetical protein OEY25_06695 [Candidatus Aminicenantes bacterium]|nr:hypothetical protein [Candidatus Aminicenantes bacterium]MDH5707075.1 hypothetical protein [Candidatus Aminicenantes bacterium]